MTSVMNISATAGQWQGDHDGHCEVYVGTEAFSGNVEVTRTPHHVWLFSQCRVASPTWEVTSYELRDAEDRPATLTDDERIEIDRDAIESARMAYQEHCATYLVLET